jgi:aryl-alcohol dehydrogenase-like predicted oxidoreductase
MNLLLDLERAPVCTVVLMSNTHPQLPHRRIGRTEVNVSPLGFGCWAIGGPFTYCGIPAGWGPTDDAASVAAIHCALDLGITLFDTAANYGVGHSEAVLGRALTGRRSDAIVATKFGHRIDRAVKAVDAHTTTRDVLNDLQPSIEHSLRHLQTDYIDILQLHVGDYPADEALEVREALEGLVAAGKIRSYGWSTDAVESARLFAEGPHCSVIQHDLNVVYRADDMLRLCESASLSSLCRTPLARGALTGKFTSTTVFGSDDVRNDPWFQDTFFKPTIAKLDVVRDILTADGRTLTQGALAWLWAISPKTIPIPGMRTVSQVQENVTAMEFGPLSPEDMAAIDRALHGED